MKYEIAYVTSSGNTEKLAHGIADKLPFSDTFVTDLSCEDMTDKAEIYILCFGVNKGSVPLKIMDALEVLEGKTIVFCVTCGMEPITEYRDEIEKKLIPFLPDNCNYKGLFLCQGQFPDNVLRAAKQRLEIEPDDKYAQKIIEDAKLSEGHPNERDFEFAYEFLRRKDLL